jgi:hypothetical protein
VDGRLERYRRLLAVLLDQQPPTPRAAAFSWLAAALEAGPDAWPDAGREPGAGPE